MHEKRGGYARVDIRGTTGLVLNDAINLRLFFAHWQHGFAVTDGQSRSFEFFDRAERSTRRRSVIAGHDHMHLLIEADDGQRLSAGMRGLTIRLARAVNRALGRRGALWGDRFHARALTSPRAMRNALVYVIMNAKKHGGGAPRMDGCSSAPWFAGWGDGPVAPSTAPAPVCRPRTWLAAVGWRRWGLVDLDEAPRRKRATRRRPRGSFGPVVFNGR